MTSFTCKYCGRPMKVSFLEYKSNSYCNDCFDERAMAFSPKTDDTEVFEFMGVSILISEATRKSKGDSLPSRP